MLFIKGQQAWNKGLTKENDLRVKKSANKRNGQKRNINSWNKGKTKETDEKIRIISIKQKEAWKRKTAEELEKFKQKLSNSQKGRSTWNLGLTKETDIRVKQYGESESKTKKEKGCRAWNKDKEGIYKIETLEKMRLVKLGKPSNAKGYHHTLESKEKNRKSHIGKPTPRGAGWGHGSWYDSPLQGTIWIRSTYEFALAEYLDQHNILWYYEPKTFLMTINIDSKEKDTSYTPDFYLPETNSFIEVKGYMKEKSKLKLEKFKYDYSYYIDMLFYEDLLKLGINLKYYVKKKVKKLNKVEISYEKCLKDLFCL